MSEAGALAANIMQFTRLLRRAGLPAGPAEARAGGQALTHIEIGERAQVQAALRAVMTHRHEQAEIFDAAFEIFWRNRNSGITATTIAAPPAPGARRLAEALQSAAYEQARDEDATINLSFSGAEKLRQMDFEAMSAASIAQAKAEIAKLRLSLDQIRTRRFRASASGQRIDVRATLAQARRTGGEILTLARTARRQQPPPLVVLCDISGSMSRYAEILLHFLHAIANHRDRVSVFLFGTRLSNISRQLRNRDPEAALASIGTVVKDFSGGTRIGEALQNFNRLWARRVLGQGAVVLLMTDGLDRDGAAGLNAAMERLHRSSRRLIWLNPLLRWEGFTPINQGARAMLPHVDEFRPVHNLASLSALVAALSAPARRARA